jgi:hypothetical protein
MKSGRGRPSGKKNLPGHNAGGVRAGSGRKRVKRNAEPEPLEMETCSKRKPEPLETEARSKKQKTCLCFFNLACMGCFLSIYSAHLRNEDSLISNAGSSESGSGDFDVESASTAAPPPPKKLFSIFSKLNTFLLRQLY